MSFLANSSSCSCSLSVGSPSHEFILPFRALAASCHLGAQPRGLLAPGEFEEWEEGVEDYIGVGDPAGSHSKEVTCKEMRMKTRFRLTLST